MLKTRAWKIVVLKVLRGEDGGGGQRGERGLCFRSEGRERNRSVKVKD